MQMQQKFHNIQTEENFDLIFLFLVGVEIYILIETTEYRKKWQNFVLISEIARGAICSFKIEYLPTDPSLRRIYGFL